MPPADAPERYGLSWPGKRDARALLHRPSRATLLPVPEESVRWDGAEHVFIEGDNLEVLKLLQRPLFGRVGMIYIDPPYNTGQDFIYRDDFRDPLGHYLRATGQQDRAGNLLVSNPETGGRYHSAWLSMMYPRLWLARQLLREDGVLFVSIDYNEEPRLRLLLDEIFGEENYRNTFTVARVKKNIRERERVRGLNQGTGSVLFYARSDRATIRPPTKRADKKARWHAFDAPGVRSTMEYPLFGHRPPPGRHWMYEEARARAMIARGELRPHPRTGKPQYHLAASDRTLLDTDWTDLQESDSRWVRNGGKNPALLRRLIGMIDDPEALVLDFFAGSCTTAEAVLAANREDGGRRRFVMVQLPEPVGRDATPRTADAVTIADIGRARIRAALEDAGDGAGLRVFRLAPSHFGDPDEDAPEDIDALLAQMETWADPLRPGWTPEGVLWEVALREAFAPDARVERAEDTGDATVWVVRSRAGERRLYVCLDERVEAADLAALPADESTLLVCRDAALSDSALANLALRFRVRTV